MKIILLLLLFLLSYSEELIIHEPIKIVTEEMKPFNYEENDTIIGSATTIVNRALQEIRFDKPVSIRIYPWARAYKMATKEKNVLIYSIVRVPPRENLFKWVAKVGILELGVFTRKGRKDIIINNLKDLNKYKTAIFIDSALQHYLEKEGVIFERTVGNAQTLPPMLLADRIDLVPASVEGFYSMAEKQGYSRDEFEVIFTFKQLQKDLYAAFSNETSDTIVTLFKKAFEKALLEEQ